MALGKEPPHVIGARVARALAGERADVGLLEEVGCVERGP